MGLQTSLGLRFTEATRGIWIIQYIIVFPHSSKTLKMCPREIHLSADYTTNFLYSPVESWQLQCRVHWLFQSNSFFPVLFPLLPVLSMASQLVMCSCSLAAAQPKRLGRVSVQSEPWKSEDWVPATAPLSLPGPLFSAMEFTLQPSPLPSFSSNCFLPCLSAPRNDLSTYFPGKIENI